MNKSIYLDYAATTPVDVRVVDKMIQCLSMEGNFGNPASRSHFYGWQAEAAVEGARRQVADLVGCDPREIVWTSGATESDNLAIKGAAFANVHKGKHVITSSIEHKAVLDSCAYLARQGFEVEYLSPELDGVISLDKVLAALRADTVLVSLMHVNNEIGVITDIAEIGAVLRKRGVLFHVDAAQSLGKLPIDLSRICVDLMSFSGHKIYGPKGIGVLYVRRSPDVKISAQMHGGGHERGMRSGTLATHQIVGMGEACAIAGEALEHESNRLLSMRTRFWQKLTELPDVFLNGSEEQRIAGNLNVAFGGVDGESLLMALREIAISSGSACTSASVEPSYVLKGIGLENALAHASIRISLGRFTTDEEVERASQHVVDVVSKLRK